MGAGPIDNGIDPNEAGLSARPCEAMDDEQGPPAAKEDDEPTDGVEKKTPLDALDQLIVQGERLAEGVKGIARQGAEQQAAKILGQAEIKAWKQIIQPAQADAAAKSREIMAKGEEEAEHILATIREVCNNIRDQATPAFCNSDATDVESEDSIESAGSNGEQRRPLSMDARQREVLKDVIAKRTRGLPADIDPNPVQ